MPCSYSPQDWYILPTNFSRMESRGSLAGLRSEITSKLPIIQEIFQQQLGKNYHVATTAGQEWNPKHGLFSLRHTGFAIDIRTKDLPGGGTGNVAKVIRDRLKQRLGTRYYVLFHTP